MKKYYPLFLVEFYLISTLLIFWFGPVQFRVHDPELFNLLFILYHLSFILGYMIFTKTFSYTTTIYENKFSNLFFYTVFAFGFLGLLMTYQNAMLSSSLIPYNIVSEVIKGLTEPGIAYSERMMNNPYSGEGTSSSRIMNILSLFFAFNKLLFIFIFLYFWKNLSFLQKSLSVIYCLFFLSSGIASGTNSVLFLFFIFFSLSFIVITYKKNPKLVLRLIIFFGILFLIPIGSFGFIMSERGGSFDYFVGSSPLGDISVDIETPELNGLIDFYIYAFTWLNYYLVQGYYGFSLIIGLDWDWTFGFGNSEFLQRQFLMLTGIDISHYTFQAKITDVWHKTAQWHSFYGQFANDFGIIGLSVLMFIIGGLLSRVWLSVIYNNNIYGMALLPLLIIMFVFFPANNQIFGFIDTFSYFIFVVALWYLRGKKILFQSKKLS